MSLIWRLSVCRSTLGVSQTRLFSWSSACSAKPKKSSNTRNKNSYDKKNQLQYPAHPGKRTGSKRRLLLPKQKTPMRRSNKSGPTNEETDKLGFGEYSKLKTIKIADYKNAQKLVSKIDNFEALKLLPPVRNAVVESIKKNTVLNNKNFAGPNRHENKNEGTVPKELVIRPSPIQVAAIKIISQYLLKPELTTYTIAAETGSGKTWAYLAPLIDSLKHEEMKSDWEQVKTKAIIRSVILVPTHELVDQVYQSAKDVFEKLELNCVKWDIGLSHQEFAEVLKNRIDILITTPGKVNNIQRIRIISNPQYVFQRTKYLVVDEADTLMDRSWIDDTCGAIKRFPNVTNMVFCSATIPAEFNKSMEKLFPTAIPITTPSLHKLPKSIKFHLIDAEQLPYQGSKIKALAQVLYAIHLDGTEEGYEKRCIVFVNEKRAVGKIAEHLTDNYNHDVVTLTGEDTAEDRLSKVKTFTDPPRKLEDVAAEEVSEEDYYTVPKSNIVMKRGKNKKREPRLKVLVTTDLLARGLNFSAVRNVVLYDVPRTSADLVHRAGRTGRMNQSGRVFLITDKSAKPWVKKLPSTVRNHGLIS